MDPPQLVQDENVIMSENTALSAAEQAALRTFRMYLVTPGKMLCFFGPNLEKHEAALDKLTRKDLLRKDNFKGAWSLTDAGYQAMKTCEE